MPRNPNKVDYTSNFPPGFTIFEYIEDPRTGNNRKHHFGEVMFISVTAMLCGMNSFSEIVEFAELQEDWFKKWITLPNGIPTQQTFSNIFQLIDTKQFIQCLTHHIRNLYPELASQLIAVDGKTLRGSKGLKEPADHCVSAWAVDVSSTLALEYVEKKSNEITAIPKLLKQLELKGHVVSVDAMGTQTAIAHQIVEQKADYLMALKANQSAIHNEVIDQFEFATHQIKMEKSDRWSLDEKVDKSNGRITVRKVAVTNDLDWMVQSIRNRWQGLRSLIMVETSSTKIGEHMPRKQKRYYMSSLDADAATFQKLIREHWSIENQCHWVLDTLFREDHQQVNAKQAAKNMGVLRRMILNLLKSDQTLSKSLPKKQLHALMNIEFRERVLSLA